MDLIKKSLLKEIATPIQLSEDLATWYFGKYSIADRLLSGIIRYTDTQEGMKREIKRRATATVQVTNEIKNFKI